LKPPLSHATRQRGSAILYILFMVLAISIIVLVGAELGMSNIRQEIRYEDKVAADRTADAALAQVDADNSKGTLILPTTRQFALNGFTGTLTISDNSVAMANSIMVSTTLTAPDGRTYPISAILSKGHIPSAWDYAMVSDSSPTVARALTFGATGANGDIFVFGDMDFANTSVVNGNASATGVVSGNPTVTGTTNNLASALFTYPSAIASDYANVATNYYSGTLTTVGWTFSNGQPYDVVYVAGDLDLTGIIAGKGTFYVGGNVNINSAISFANANSHVGFISPNSISLANNSVGYFYSGGTFLGTTATITLGSGGIVASAVSLLKSSTVILDPFVHNNSAEGVSLHLPGFAWTVTNLFAGSHSGTFTISATGDNGTLNVTVANNGAVTGSIFDNALNQTGTISGVLTNSGIWNATLTYPSGTWTSTGNLTKGAGVSGTIVETSGATQYTLAVNLS